MPHAFLIIAITSLLLLISICGYCVWKPSEPSPLGDYRGGELMVLR
jgi:hypothetical protein